MQRYTVKLNGYARVLTECSIKIFRQYAGVYYTRASGIFGDREPITVQFSVLGYGGYADIEFYLDGNFVGTAKTNIGMAEYIFEKGLTKGQHTIKGKFLGEATFEPCEATVTLTTVGMVVSYFKAYVLSLNATAGEIETGTMNKLLVDQIGAIVTKVELDMDRNRYIYTILIPEESTSPMVAFGFWAIVIGILLAISAVLVAYAVATYVTVVYVFGQYQCGVCNERFTICEALKEHLITQHPDVWDKIKENFEYAPPGIDYLKWGLILGGVAVFGYLGVKAFEAARRR